jgi:hypothetical protein
LLVNHILATTACCAIFNSVEVLHFAQAREGVIPNDQTFFTLDRLPVSGPFDVAVGKQQAAAIGGANAFLDVQARARSGGIRVKAAGLASASANIVNEAIFNGRASASWKDDITLTIPGDPFFGHIAVNAVLNLHGTFEVDPGPLGDGLTNLQIFEAEEHQPSSLPPAPSQICQCWGQIRKNSEGSSNVVILPPTQIPVRIDIFFPGSTVGGYALGYKLEVVANGHSGSGPGLPAGIEVTTADFSNTLSWGGITSVEKLSTGEPITDYTISSSSGFDYTKSFEAQEPIPGDFNNDGILGVADVDDLTSQSAGGTNPSAYDLNADALVNLEDVNLWVKDLFGSWIGDANLDHEFNSSDLVDVLAAGTYEADVAATWSTGDFDGSGRFDSSDLVAALADGGYEQGPPAAVSAVPEQASFVMLTMGLIGIAIRRLHFGPPLDSRGAQVGQEAVGCQRP